MSTDQPSRLERLCLEKGLKMTDQRRVIARVLSESSDHPDVEQVYRRATEIDSRISIATVYRTVRLFEEASILERHDFGDGRSRYEEAPSEHHDHLIDVESDWATDWSGTGSSSSPYRSIPNGSGTSPVDQGRIA